jgi:hypothetical protein
VVENNDVVTQSEELVTNPVSVSNNTNKKNSYMGLKILLFIIILFV